MQMEVRRFTPEDWETLREVRLAALLDAPYAFLSTYEGTVGWTEEAWRARPVAAAMFGGFLDGRPSGMVGLIPPPPGETSCDLIAMWVAPHSRGSGLADALIAAALELAAQWGVTSVLLEVAPGNDRAERVYRRHGFVPDGQPPQREQDLVMRRTLATAGL